MCRGVLRGDLVWLDPQGLLGDSTEATRNPGYSRGVGGPEAKPRFCGKGAVTRFEITFTFLASGSMFVKQEGYSAPRLLQR